MPDFSIYPLSPADRPSVAELIRQRWGAETVIAHGITFLPAELDGFIARNGEQVAGLITYRIEGRDCEIITIDSLAPKQGIGQALIKAVAQTAHQQGCERVWLITTNDNLDALRFYQKRGFGMVKVYPGAVDEARKLKPEIPEVGEFGIPIRDEIEMELRLIRTLEQHAPKGSE